jgi:hypothetical protein
MVRKLLLTYLKTVPNVYVLPQAASGRSRLGAPDWVLCHNGRFIGLEAKATDKSPLRPGQKKNKEQIEKAGGTYHTLHAGNWEEIKKYVR